ncbi:MAG: PAS domain S-box protein [Candidatus Cloacimonetes bacterium]|nr:PAS domain S-box protein [Candidatus Cloacimonadota bacterium]
MKKLIKVLMLEDNPSDAALILRELRKGWHEVQYTRVFSGDDMKTNLYAEEWDLIISDYSMPQFTGVDGLQILKANGLDLPFIMVSGTMGEDVAVSVMKAGAQDYILKDKLHRLLPAIERELYEKSLRIKHKITSKALDESEALSQAVIEGSPIGISVRDKNGTLKLANKSWQRIWGFTDEQVLEYMQERSSLNFDSKDTYLGEYQDDVKNVYIKGIDLYIPELKLKNRRHKKAEWITQHFYALSDKNESVERVVVLTEDITERKSNERRKNLTRLILQLLNRHEDWNIIQKKILFEIQQVMDVESLAVRFSQDDDYPFFETLGFREEFIEKECYLHSPDYKQKKQFDGKTEELACLCGKIIRQEFDKKQPYFTENGSFWTNNLPELVKLPEFDNDQIISRYTCLKEGFKALALIPMVSESTTLGLIMLSDKRTGIFSSEMIKYLEEIGATLAIAYQRKQSEKRVIDSEKQFRSLFENSVMGIFRLSSEGKILMMNPCLLDFLGYSSLEEFNLSEIAPADDFKRIIRKLYNNIKVYPENVHQFEASWTKADGKNIYVRTSSKTILDENKKLLFIDGTIEDRTERLKASRALLESREMYRSLVEKANVGIVTDDKNCVITYFNQKFAELFGYTQREMSELSYDDIFHPDNISLMRQHHEMRINGKEAPSNYELKGIKKDGSIINLAIAVDHILDEEFNIIGTRAFVWDVTARKQAEAIQSALYNTMAINSAENLNELYLKIKEHLGTIIDTTNIFVAMYDKEKDELSLPFEVDERDHFETFPAGNSITSYVIKTKEAIMLTEADIDNLAEAGKIDLIGTSAKIWLGVPLKIGDEIIGAIVVQSYDNANLYSIEDLKILSIISNEIAIAIDKKRAEEKLLRTNEELIKLHKSLEEKVIKAVAESREKDQVIMQQSRQAAVGEMISSIAHHWRQPLNVIGVTFQSVREAFEFDELTNEYMEDKTQIIMDILQSLSKTIDNFRYFYSQDDSIVDFDVQEIISNTVYTIQSKLNNSQIILKQDIDSSITIKGNKNEFSQVLLNLLNNAYDILLERRIENPCIEIKLEAIEGKTRLSIYDNGGGVNEDIKDNIFDLYISTKKNLNNTGIGLYIAKLIIEGHMSGRLYFENREAGAEFIIEL